MNTLPLYTRSRLSFPKRIVNRIYRYIQELIFCHKVGNDLESALMLSFDTFRFHAASKYYAKNTKNANTRKYKIRIEELILDIYLRLYSGDFFIFHEIFLDPCYVIPQRYLTEVTNIIDLGANIGLTTIFFATRFPKATCVCVEPEISNLQILKKNVSWLQDRGKIIEGAVSDCSGPAIFDTSSWSWGGHLDGQREQGQLVQCYTMKEVLENSGLSNVDILKVDIEGAERQLFSGNNDWLENVRVIIIELHDGYSVQDFQRDVTKNGFTVFLPDMKRGNRMIIAVSNKYIDI